MDPVYLNAKRETCWMLVIWVVFAAWVLGVSAWLGYDDQPNAPIQTVLGFPKWAFWGVAIPWLGANLVIIAFAVKIMKDDPLDEGGTPAYEKKAGMTDHKATHKD